MKFLHSLISFALCVALLLLGGFLVGNFFGLKCPFCEFLFTAPIGRLGLGVCFILGPAFFWLTAISARSCKERYLSFDNESGAVSVSVGAVNAFLSKLGHEFAGIVNMRSDVTGVGRDAVEIQLDLTVKAGTKIQELSQLLQQRVRDSMRDSLGISDISAVKVKITEIISNEAANAAVAEREEWHNTL
jgi:uncharacterized alkaline shock family protein YloU